MKYVKLTSKPDTWFKSGTEVFHYDQNRRVTLKEFESAKEFGDICVRGTRVCQSVREQHEIDEEYEDGELCLLDEFEVETIDE